MLDINKVLENLCFYDPRNPFYDNDEGIKRPDPCYCDSCHKGKNELAEYILELLDYKA